MKLKQALIIGLSSTILAIPAFAAETDPNGLPAANANQPASRVIPARKDTFRHHKKGEKKVSMEKKVDPKQTEENAKLDELNTLNSQTAEKDQTEKNAIKS